MVDWAQRYDCPVYLHVGDREWITHSDGRLELWDGETLDLGDGLTLIRCGATSCGSNVLHMATRCSRATSSG